LSTQEVRAIFEAYWGAISAGRLDNLEQFFTEDAVFEDTTLGHIWRGRDEIVGILRKFFSAMPTRLEIEFFTGAGRRIRNRLGQHRGPCERHARISASNG
jgi:ketosteroid isomerase-like protein